MPINNLPGVGPTNADIATAVAAPSAATIASTVAGSVPTLAQINTAVNTQTNNSAIATAVAGAVPTLAQITSTVQANAGSPFGGTYTNLGTTNLPQNATSYTLSGLSGYKYLKIGCNFFCDGGYTPTIRFNSDTNTNYLQSNITFLNNTTTPTRVSGANLTFFRPSLAGNYQLNANVRLFGHITIKNAASGAYKEVDIILSDSGGSYRFEVTGLYVSTSAISTMTISSTEIVGNVGGSVYVIGAN